MQRANFVVQTYIKNWVVDGHADIMTYDDRSDILKTKWLIADPSIDIAAGIECLHDYRRTMRRSPMGAVAESLVTAYLSTKGEGRRTLEDGSYLIQASGFVTLTPTGKGKDVTMSLNLDDVTAIKADEAQLRPFFNVTPRGPKVTELNIAWPTGRKIELG